MTTGYLALVLHAHLPFIRHPEYPEFLEERWLFEAITECYVPLIRVFQGLYRDGVPFRVTLSLSPPLISMLGDPLLQERYLKYLGRLLELAEKECRRTSGHADFNQLARMYRERLQEVWDTYANMYQGDLLGAFRDIYRGGGLELITCCATHGYLPLIRTPEARRAQVHVGTDVFERVFGHKPPGMWLPECAYLPGVDKLLHGCGIGYFLVDTHGLLYARPRPRYGVYAPLTLESGVAVFGRDPESSRQVWDRHTGYPGDYFYREFYRDIGYELDENYLRPYLGPDGIRVDTGFKYYRITGPGGEKQPYLPDRARERAGDHAANFIYSRTAQASLAAPGMDRPPLMVSPYDAELFGHWWYEGPMWLDFLCRRLHHDQQAISLITPSQYLEQYPADGPVDLPMSSWGDGGYNEVWLNPSNDWVYRHLHRAESAMVALADLNPGAEGLMLRGLSQAGRELLLAQSSDWTFIMRTGTAVEYARRRVNQHLARFNLLAEMLSRRELDEAPLARMEQLSPIFPHLNYSIFSSHFQVAGTYSGNSCPVLMLAWEYPPKTVGGLARAVHDLSVALARLGDEVHVLTCPAPGVSSYRLVEGVHVHAVPEEGLNAEDFLAWVGQLNQGMITLADQIISRGTKIKVVHAHDWLVGEAAREISHRHGLPVVATIHATEHGRNGGIFNSLQHLIHGREEELTGLAGKVICCSRHMAREVRQLFNQPADKIRVIPNGVDLAALGPGAGVRNDYAPGEKPVIVFLGRLVPEKGVQVLLRALTTVAEAYPGVSLVVAGRGPYEEHLRQLAGELGVSGRVDFAGFVNDDGRNELLARANVAVFPSLYEPFGIVALEAMGAGAPVIVSDTGGLRDVVEHGLDGYRAPPGRDDLLARYIIEILDQPELAREMSRRAWQKVLTCYNWSYIAAETCGVYLEVIK
ncbi:MAG: 1,4-alpha-glucan branching protein domain-containing protein [Bacillota bacterium]|jgi:1,4-alpha-glucan branching enzyme